MNAHPTLVEGPVDYLKTRIGAHLGKAVNSTMAAMGSQRAKSRLDARVVADKMNRDWRYWSEAAGVRADGASLAQFFKQKYGVDLAHLGVSFNDAQGGSTERTEPHFGPEAPAPAPSAQHAERRANIQKNFGKPQQASQNVADYQNKTIGELMRAVRANPAPGHEKIQGKEVMTLAHELVQHARDYGGPEKERVKLFLQKLKKDDNTLRRFPGLARLTLESRNHLIDFATFLVETEASTKTGRALLEGYHRFIAEDISESDLDRFFMTIAKAMIQHNLVKVHPKNNPPSGGGSQPTTGSSTPTLSGGHASPNGASTATPAANTNAQGRKTPTFTEPHAVIKVKKDDLKKALHDHGVSNAVVNKIITLGADASLDADNVADALRGLDRDEANHAMAVLLKTISFK